MLMKKMYPFIRVHTQIKHVVSYVLVSNVVVLTLHQIGKFMSSNLDFFSAKSGVRTRGMTTAADGEVNFISLTLTLFIPNNSL